MARALSYFDNKKKTCKHFFKLIDNLKSQLRQYCIKYPKNYKIKFNT